MDGDKKKKKSGVYNPVSNSNVEGPYIVGKNYIQVEGGKNVRRKYLGRNEAGGTMWQGVKMPKMKTVKDAPKYNSKKRKTSKRKYGKYI